MHADETDANLMLMSLWLGTGRGYWLPRILIQTAPCCLCELQAGSCQWPLFAVQPPRHAGL